MFVSRKRFQKLEDDVRCLRQMFDDIYAYYQNLPHSPIDINISVKDSTESLLAVLRSAAGKKIITKTTGRRK